VSRPHSHDSADSVDSVDSALQRTGHPCPEGQPGLVALLATALPQGVVVAFSGSVALLAHTVHDLSDAGTAVPLPRGPTSGQLARVSCLRWCA
jgi:hypothetical protein